MIIRDGWFRFSSYFELALLLAPLSASAQFVPDAGGQSATAATGPVREVEAKFDKHKLMVRAREIQYHEKAGELRVLLELHDESREGRRMAIWLIGDRSLQLYDNFLNSRPFIESSGVKTCGVDSGSSCAHHGMYSILSPSNPTFMVLKFSADNLQSTGPAAVSVPVIYWLIKSGKSDGHDYVADTITFRDLPIRVIK